jgi:hypothetical protein
MTDTRDFPLADILSITTGRLLSHRHMDGVYEILNHLTGDNLMTHQLPRAAETCRPALIAQHPFLVDLTVAEAETKHGTSFPVTPLAVWERRNPIAEAVEMFGPDRVIPVVLPEARKAAS